MRFAPYNYPAPPSVAAAAVARAASLVWVDVFKKDTEI